MVNVNNTFLSFLLFFFLFQDYLELRNGRTADSPVIGRYCGLDYPKDLIYSSGSWMRMEFVSNRDNKRGNGFMAKFRTSHLGKSTFLSP